MATASNVGNTLKTLLQDIKTAAKNSELSVKKDGDSIKVCYGKKCIDIIVKDNGDTLVLSTSIEKNLSETKEGVGEFNAKISIEVNATVDKNFLLAKIKELLTILL